MKNAKHKNGKRLFTIVLAALLITCLIAFYAPESLAAEQSVIRVKLSVGSVTTFNFKLNGSYGIKGAGISLADGSYTVKSQSGALGLYCGSTLLYSGSDITVEEYAPASGYNYITLATAKYGTNKYRGNLQFKLNSGKIDVINHIYLEYYLYGVVPHEMSNSWPLEALKTQAVAARTYAKRYMTGSGSYDVVDTSTHQVYKGYNEANTNAIRAVDETAKTVLKCANELVQTYYAASNGGYVDIPQHLWSSSAPIKPYHVIQADPYDTQNTWSLQEVLIFPKVMEGSAIQYKYSDSGSMVAKSGTEAANALRYLKISALPAAAQMGYIASVTSDIEIVGITDITAHTHEGQHGSVKDYNGSNTCPVFTKADVSMTVKAYRQATPEETDISGEPLTQEEVNVTFTIDMHRFDEQDGLYQAFNNSSLRLFVIEETDTSWNIYHRRYGHGVGMSQRGAQTRAKAGQTYKQILSFYYPNTYFEALNISPPALQQPQDNTNATVINCSTAVNVRSTPDTSKPAIGSAAKGARLIVTQPFVNSDWHKISLSGADAYIYAYYVKLDPAAASPSASPTDAPSVTPTDAPSAPPSDAPTATPTDAPSATPTATPPDTANASVINCKTAVNLRSTPDTGKASIGSAALGLRLTVTQPFVTPTWHKISFNGRDAYIYAYYVKLDSAPSPSPSPTTSPAPTASAPPVIVRTGTVNSSILNVRSAASSSSGKLGTLSKGSAVNIIEVEPVKNWHKILYNNAAAYVWADYVTLSGGSTLPAVQATGVVTSSTLNVRSGPGTSYAKAGVLNKGAKVDITKTNYTSSWHQIIYGGKIAYVHKSYIRVSSAGSGGSVQPEAVYASVNVGKLNFRADANTRSKVYGSLLRGTVVQVLQKGSKWHKVKYGGKEGYMYASYLKELSAVYGKVTISSLNVRSGLAMAARLSGSKRRVFVHRSSGKAFRGRDRRDSQHGRLMA